MSAVRATGTAASQAVPAGDGWHRPVLRLVRTPIRKAPRLPFVILVVVLLSIGLAGLLLLSLQRNQAAFAQGRLATTNAGLADQVQALQRQVEADQNPAVLASRAAALGMVPDTGAGYLGANGAVLGPVPSGAPTPAAGAAGTDGVVVAGAATAAPAAAPTAAPKPAAKASATAAPKASATTAPKASATTARKTSPTASSTSAHPKPTPTRTGTR